MKPTIGRIVHYQQVYAHGPGTPPEVLESSPALLTRAAVVTDVHEVDGVTWPVLRVLAGPWPSDDFAVDCRPGGYQQDGVLEARVPTMGCWNWPRGNSLTP